MLRKTKIVCTLGPSTDQEGVMRNMIVSGMNVARFNFSHGSHEEHAARLETARRNALNHHRKYAYAHLLAAIEQERDDDPGRGGHSMTSCGRTGRRRRPRTTAEVNIINYRRGWE